MEGRLARARRDVRLVHSSFFSLLDRLHPLVWEQEVLDGWTGGETCLHLVLVMERVLADVRLAAAQGVPDPEPRMGLSQKLGQRLLWLTWKLPAGFRLRGSHDPGGLNPPRPVLEERSVRWAAGFLRFFQDQTPTYLGNLKISLPRIGLLTPLEWPRFLRIYLRTLELQLPIRPLGKGLEDGKVNPQG